MLSAYCWNGYARRLRDSGLYGRSRILTTPIFCLQGTSAHFGFGEAPELYRVGRLLLYLFFGNSSMYAP